MRQLTGDIFGCVERQGTQGRHGRTIVGWLAYAGRFLSSCQPPTSPLRSRVPNMSYFSNLNYFLKCEQVCSPQDPRVVRKGQPTLFRISCYDLDFAPFSRKNRTMESHMSKRISASAACPIRRLEAYSNAFCQRF